MCHGHLLTAVIEIDNVWQLSREEEEDKSSSISFTFDVPWSLTDCSDRDRQCVVKQRGRRRQKQFNIIHF